MENDIYSFVDVGVLVKRCDVKENGKHYARRHIEQICTFSRENGENIIDMKPCLEPEYREVEVLEENNANKEKISVWKGGGTYYEKKEVI